MQRKTIKDTILILVWRLLLEPRVYSKNQLSNAYAK